MWMVSRVELQSSLSRVLFPWKRLYLTLLSHTYCMHSEKYSLWIRRHHQLCCCCCNLYLCCLCCLWCNLHLWLSRVKYRIIQGNKTRDKELWSSILYLTLLSHISYLAGALMSTIATTAGGANRELMVSYHFDQGGWLEAFRWRWPWGVVRWLVTSTQPGPCHCAQPFKPTCVCVFLDLMCVPFYSYFIVCHFC